MSTASSVAASASSRWPSSLEAIARLLSNDAEIGQGGVGPLGGQAAVNARPPPPLPRARPRAGRVRSALPRLLSDDARSGREASGRSAVRRRQTLGNLLRHHERVLVPAEFAQAIAEIVERHREIAQVGVGQHGDEAATDFDRLLRRRERVLAPAEFAQLIAETA